MLRPHFFTDKKRLTVYLYNIICILHPFVKRKKPRNVKKIQRVSIHFAKKKRKSVATRQKICYNIEVMQKKKGYPL